MKDRLAASALLVLAAALALLAGSRLLSAVDFSPTPVAFLNRQILYQPFLLALAGLVILVALRLSPGAKAFLRAGDWRAPARKAAFFGIQEGESWLRVGLGLGIVITLATAGFMAMGVRQAGGDLRSALPWLGPILLLSLTNSLGEEILFRFGFAPAAAAGAEPGRIRLASAILFGLPHWGGAPGGPAGVLMSGILGWVLAKSMLETRGLLWAWAVHFLQDVVIFACLVAMRP